MLRSNDAFERPCGAGGPRLTAAEASWRAAQLNRLCSESFANVAGETRGTA
jgi:hypothetical protein